MSVQSLSVCLTAAFSASTLFAASSVRLPAGGTEVVIAPSAPPAVRFAAAEATNFLSQTFGADVPLVTEPSAGRAHLFLGTNAWSAAAGVDVSRVATDGYVLLAKGNDVFLAGADDPKVDPVARIAKPSWGFHTFDHGTLNGVYGFLEKFADVRFYFPGELGTCVAPRNAVEVPEGRRVDEPDLQTRTWSLFSDGAWFEGEKPVQLCHPSKALNILRQRVSTKNYGCCHGLNGFRYLDRFGKTHPEYFAIDEKGNRMMEGQGWRRGHLCLTSGIRDEIFKDCLSYCKGEDASVRGIPGPYADKRWGKKFDWNYNVTPLYIDLMPQDGGAICHCDRCKAQWRKDGRKSPMTEIVWGLLAEVAARLKAEGFEPTLTLMSYADYNDLPDCPLPKNVKVMIARTGPWANAGGKNIAEDDAYYASWERRLGDKPWIWTYPNRGPCNSLNVDDVPGWAPRAWGRYYQGVSKHIFGFFAESETERAIDNLMGCYLLAHIGWDRSLDVDATMDEFYVRMFGPAALEMKTFLDRVEERWTKDVAGTFVMTDIGPKATVPGEHDRWTKIYSDEEMALWRRLFAAAAAKVKRGSVEERRIALFWKWMYKPPAQRGAAYRKSIDVESGKAYYLAKAAENLLGDDWWVATSSGALRDREVTCVSGESKQLHCEKQGMSVWALSNRMKKGLSLKPGATYRLSRFVKVDLVPNRPGAGAAMGVSLDGSDATRPKWTKSWWFPQSGGYHAGKVDWICRSVEFTVPEDAPANVRASAGPFMCWSTGKAWFDGLLLEEVPR